MMLRRWVALGVFVTLAAVGIACGSPPEPTPTPTPEPTHTPTPEPTPTPTPTPEPTPQPVSKDEPVPTPTPEPQLEPVDPQEAEAIMQVFTEHWEAYNTYEPDKALGFMTADFRQTQEEEVRNNIGLLETFAAKMEATEEGPPQQLENGDAQIYLKLMTPLGERRVRMTFRKVDGEWMISFSEEVQ